MGTTPTVLTLPFLLLVLILSQPKTQPPQAEAPNIRPPAVEGSPRPLLVARGEGNRSHQIASKRQTGSKSTKEVVLNLNPSLFPYSGTDGFLPPKCLAESSFQLTCTE